MMAEANSANEYEHAANEQGEQHEQWLSVREAAEQLGVGVRAVQQRVSRGKIRHKREGERLLVCLMGLEAEPSAQDEPREQREQTAANSEQEANEQGANNANTALIEHQADEIAFLRSELSATREAAAVAQAEMRRLLLADRQEIAQLRQQLALTAAPVVVETPPAAVQQEAVPAVVQDAPIADTQDVVRDTEQGAKPEAEHQPGGKRESVQRPPEPRRWWEFWK